MVEFKNSETAAKYECLFKTDNKIYIPTVNYSGRVSDLTPKAAEELVKQQHTKIREKAAEAAGKASVVPTAGPAKTSVKADSKAAEEK